MKITIFQGPPMSGKTTWANQMLLEYPEHRIVKCIAPDWTAGISACCDVVLIEEATLDLLRGIKWESIAHLDRHLIFITQASTWDYIPFINSFNPPGILYESICMEHRDGRLFKADLLSDFGPNAQFSFLPGSQVWRVVTNDLNYVDAVNESGAMRSFSVLTPVFSRKYSKKGFKINKSCK